MMATLKLQNTGEKSCQYQGFMKVIMREDR